MESLWKNFDKIYCINLKEREDKYKYCTKIFKELGIPVEFYHPDKHPNGGTQGCFESHIYLAKKAYDSGCENVLIFEDDIMPHNVNEKRLREVVDFLKNHSWDIFYLGLCPYFFTYPKKIDKNIYDLRNSCAHAYILNKPYMSLLKDLKYDGVPIDTYYLYDKRTKSAGIFPSMFYQGGFKSDIQSKSIKEKFVAKNKVQLLFFYEHFIFYRIEILTVIFSIILLIILSRSFQHKKTKFKFLK